MIYVLRQTEREWESDVRNTFALTFEGDRRRVWTVRFRAAQRGTYRVHLRLGNADEGWLESREAVTAVQVGPVTFAAGQDCEDQPPGCQ